MIFRSSLIALVLSALPFTYADCNEKTRPTSPAALTAIANYEVQKLNSDQSSYDQAVASGDWDKATLIRNTSVYRLKRNIDINYNDFEADLWAKRASRNVLFDISEMAASSVIGFTNGDRVKSVIGTVLTGFKGARKSIDDNFFRSQSMDAIISKMQASRSRAFTRMAGNLNTLSAQSYSLDEALGDLIEYFYAGSLQRGLQELSQQAGADAIQAKVEANAVQEIRLASETEFDNSKKIRLRITELVRTLRGTDATAAANARTIIKEALSAEGVPVADNITDDDLVKALVARSVTINRSANRQAGQDQFLRNLKVQ